MRFEIPADFDFEKLTQSSFDVVWGEPQEVKIYFSPDQAPYVEERTWHPSQKIDKHSDGSIVSTLQVANLWEVQRWLIVFGSDASVLEPPELKERIKRGCAKVIRRHVKNR